MVNRKDFMKLLGLGGFNLAFGNSSVLAKGESDLEIVKLAISAEQLAVETYARAIAAKTFSGVDAVYFQNALKQEKEHLKALTKVAKSLGSTSIPARFFVFEDGIFENPLKLLHLMNDLEDAFVGAYLGALPLIKDKNILAAAGAILGVEAGHRVLLREMRLKLLDPSITGTRVPNDRIFESALTPSQAASALKPFQR